MSFKLGQRCKISLLPIMFGSKYFEGRIVGYYPAHSSYLIAWLDNEVYHWCAYDKQTMLNGLARNIVLENDYDTFHKYLWVNENDFSIEEALANSSSSNQPAKLDGMYCCKCKNYSQYAEPNQNNGTMICYSCRKYPFYGSVI